MPKSIFIKKQGDNPKNRIWCFLIVHQEYDYSLRDIAKFSKVGYTTVKRLWKSYFKTLVKQTRKVGRAKMYKLDLESPVVQCFIDFYWVVTDTEIDKQLKNKTAKHSDSSQIAVPVSAKGF